MEKSRRFGTRWRHEVSPEQAGRDKPGQSSPRLLAMQREVKRSGILA